MKILVIDKDPVVCKAFTRCLDHKNYTVFEAENGGVAKALLELHPTIKKVILDAHMQEMDSFRFLKLLQSDPKFKTELLDVYFISTFEREHIISRLITEQIEQSTIKDIFKKPIDLEELFEALQEW